MFTYVIILSALIQSLVALFVLQKNTKGRTNILFFLLSVSLVVWATINFILTNNPYSPDQLLLYRLLFASVVLQNTCFLFFAHTYPENKTEINQKFARLYLVLSALTILIALSPLLFASVEYGHGGARPVTGPGMLLFVLHAGISVISGLRAISGRYKKSVGIAKRQFRLILIASIILWGIVPVTNFVISMATQTLFFARISPIYTLAFSSIIAYAIVAHKLFDIRLAVARSVAYILIIATMMGTYSLALFGGVNILFNGTDKEFERQILTVVLLIPFALLYQRIKQFFDRFTNKLFFRDIYDSQKFYDSLNRILVAKVELEPLLHGVAALIEKDIKTEHCTFIVHKTSYAKERIIGINALELTRQDLAGLSDASPRQRSKLIFTDNLSQDNELRHLLDSKNVSVLIRLVSSVKNEEDRIGFLALGPKKSGNVYSKQDGEVLRVLTNELIIAIENSLRLEEIERFTERLQGRVNEATYKLRSSNTRLRELDETKDDFISMASHQLRTPLTSVKGYLSMVLEGDAGKLTATQKKMLGQAYVSSQRMVYLIADLLNVSRLKTGKFVIETSPTSLSDMVEEELDQLTETAAARELTLSFAKPKDFPTLDIDETKTRQVIMNFIDNAIYYTPSGGHINVVLEETPTSVELKVIDDGIGVPKSEQHHLFTKFYRAGNARKARPDGTGLGLFMAKKVILAQGGSIIFESKEGKGSTFGFLFPKNPPVAKRPIPLAKTGVN